MGEIPPLPLSMQRKLPEEGKAVELKITSEKLNNEIIISINLPDKCKLNVRDNIHKAGREIEVVNGQMVLQDAVDITNIRISSRVFSDDTANNEILGTEHRNLCGKYIEYDPVYGNRVVYYKEF